MTIGVFDFKAIAKRLNCQDQKAEHEAQNPPPPSWYSKPVVWTPNGGYGKPKPASQTGT